jgi:hypothetical protein
MTQIIIDQDAEYILTETKKILCQSGQTDVSNSDAIIWLADTINNLVDEIQQLKDELKLYKNSVSLELMR